MSTRRRRRWIGAVVVVAAAGASAYAVDGSVQDVTREDRTREAGVAVATPLVRLCDIDPARAADVAADCGLAARVAAGDLTAAPAAPVPGPEGRGVTTTKIVNGELVLSYSDGTTANVGPVVGVPGADGTPGRGITSTTVADGRLIVVYSDNTTSDLGPVVGPAGVGIRTMDGSTGRLLVTLTSGAVIDLGPLPPGRDGKDGAPAPRIASSTRIYDDQSSEVCTRIPDSPDTDPRFTCERFPPPAPTEGGTGG